MKKRDIATQKKIDAKHKEIRELRGDIIALNDRIMEGVDPEQETKLRSFISRTEQKIQIIQSELMEIEGISDELNQLQRKLTQKEENDLIGNLIKEYYMGYLVQDNKFVYCIDAANKEHCNIKNPQFSIIDATKIVSVINKMSNRLISLDGEQIKKYFQHTKNDYYFMVGSFNGEKWDNSMVYNKMRIIKEFWVQPIDQPYDPDFDFLMYTVCGGKEENINHLEQWIAYKWMFPNRNANTPNIDLGGYPGGNGKGRVIELLKTIFTHGCVVPAALKELTDGFNASWETAVILYYDEPATGELPEGKLKNATGGEEQRIEKKGIDAYTSDRNYNMIFTSNNPMGVVKLAGTGASGEDRRWSVITTNKVMVDEIMLIGCSQEEAKVRTNEINNKIKDREKVGCWLNHIINKHNIKNMAILHPLHGEDYYKRFEDQKDMTEVLFDAVRPILEHCGVITLDVVTQMVHELTNNSKISSTKIGNKFSRYLEQNKIKFDYVKNTRINLLWKGDVAETVQKNFWQLPTSHTNFGLEYSLFSNVVPSKKQKLTNQDFTLNI